MPPKTSPPARCDAATGADRKDHTSGKHEDEAPTCCWHHYMAYWLDRVAAEPEAAPPPDAEEPQSKTP